jgi:hypothetical protein
MPRRGVIYAVAPSPKDVQVIWAGTDDGLVHVTRDAGKTWKNVTPPALRAWDKVSQIDAGHADARAAYVSVNAIRRDDMRPHVFRTHDAGATWTEVVNGLPAIGSVNVVREDRSNPGCSLRAPNAGVLLDRRRIAGSRSLEHAGVIGRDLVIHDDDLVVGTHGRSIWILDGMAMLRELARRRARSRRSCSRRRRRARAMEHVCRHAAAARGTGRSESTGRRRPRLLPARGNGDVSIEILDERGGSVRRYSSRDEPERIDPRRSVSTYWLRPPQVVSAARGHHRVVWDLRYAAPGGARRDLSIAAVYHNTPTAPVGPFVHPGRYTVRLTAPARPSSGTSTSVWIRASRSATRTCVCKRTSRSRATGRISVRRSSARRSTPRRPRRRSDATS